MKTTTKTALVRMLKAVALCMCLIVPNALAAETPDAGYVPLKSMNQAEYERYRDQLDRQMRQVTSDTAQQRAVSETNTAGQSGEEASAPEASKSGYGKGYRARMKMQGTGRAGGFRGGSMSRGGGGRNR